MLGGWVGQRSRWCRLCAESKRKVTGVNLFARWKQTERRSLWSWGSGWEWGEGELGRLGLTCTTAVFKIDDRRGPAV